MKPVTCKSLADPALWSDGAISPKLYFEYRLHPLIDWYEKSGQKNNRRYRRLKFLQLLLSALVPVMVGFIGEDTVLRFIGSMKHQQIVVAWLGFLLTFITGLFSVFRFKETWIYHLKTAEDLRRETFQYLARTGPYYDKEENEAFQLLVQQVETIVKSEYTQWSELLQEDEAIASPGKPNAKETA